MNIFEAIGIVMGLFTIWAMVHYLVFGDPRVDNKQKERAMRKDRIVVKISKSGEAYWCLEANNGQCLAVSEMYSSMQKCMQSVLNLHDRLNRTEGDVVMIEDATEEVEI